MSYDKGFTERFAFCTPITTGVGITTLVPAPTATGRVLRVQALTICVTTSAAQQFNIEDNTSTVKLFLAPVSLAVGTYACDPGPLGVALPANTSLQYTANAGVGVTISGFGYLQEP